MPSIVPRRSTAFLCSAPSPFCPGFTLSDPAASACLNSTEAKTVVPLHCSQRSLHRAGGAVAASGRVAPLPCTVHAPDPTSRPSSPVAAPPPPLRLSSAGPSQAPSTSIIPFPSAGQDAPHRLHTLNRAAPRAEASRRQARMARLLFPRQWPATISPLSVRRR